MFLYCALSAATYVAHETSECAMRSIGPVLHDLVLEYTIYPMYIQIIELNLICLGLHI